MVVGLIHCMWDWDQGSEPDRLHAGLELVPEQWDQSGVHGARAKIAGLIPCGARAQTDVCVARATQHTVPTCQTCPVSSTKADFYALETINS